MPARGSAAMLWPTSTVTPMGADDWPGELPRYGFVDVTGRRTLPPRYDSYQFCDDGKGSEFVVVTAAGRRAAVLDLSGAVLAHAPADAARCGVPGTVVFGDQSDPAPGANEDGVLAVRTGRVLLPPAAGRDVAVVTRRIVNVSEKQGEYFLDLDSRTRTPHPGWSTDLALEAGAPGVPASTARPYEGNVARLGYVSLAGRWIVTPRFLEASAFHAGHAVVKLGKNRFELLDTRLRRVGDEWTRIDPVHAGDSDAGPVVGYVVSSRAGDGLLGADLRVIVPPGSSTITCDYHAAGACSVVARDGSASLVSLPTGTVRPMPPGFREALSATFVAGGEDEEAVTRVLALDAGVVVHLDGPSSCRGVGSAWVACSGYGMLPAVVIDSQGRRTAFATIREVREPGRPGGASYYWAVAAKYQGFVDAHGDWLYREPRYTTVEE